MTSIASSSLRIREIVDGDLPAVADLLSRGFCLRSKRYWLRGLKRAVDRARPEGTLPYGYLLECTGAPVGIILLFYSFVPSSEGNFLRCNLSSWFVKPEFKTFGPLLALSAIKDKSVTYFNISAAPYTWPIVEAQGFSIYCRGEMIAIPALARPIGNVSIEIATKSSLLPDLPECALLQQHAHLNCLSLVLRCEGLTYPFIFQRYRVKRVLPTYRLIYCRDLIEFVHFAGNLGRYLLLQRATPFVLIDANEAISELVGFYSERRGRKYAKGSHIPKLGDLAFSESVFFDA
jgi:hypothetical protein